MKKEQMESMGFIYVDVRPTKRGRAAMEAFLNGADLFLYNLSSGCWHKVPGQESLRAAIMDGIKRGPKSTYGDYPIRYSAYAYGAL